MVVEHAIAITSPTHSLGRKIEPTTIETLPFAMLVGNVIVNLFVSRCVTIDCCALAFLFWQRWWR